MKKILCHEGVQDSIDVPDAKGVPDVKDVPGAAALKKGEPNVREILCSIDVPGPSPPTKMNRQDGD